MEYRENNMDNFINQGYDDDNFYYLTENDNADDDMNNNMNNNIINNNFDNNNFDDNNFDENNFDELDENIYKEEDENIYKEEDENDHNIAYPSNDFYQDNNIEHMNDIKQNIEFNPLPNEQKVHFNFDQLSTTNKTRTVVPAPSPVNISKEFQINKKSTSVPKKSKSSNYWLYWFLFILVISLVVYYLIDKKIIKFNNFSLSSPSNTVSASQSTLGSTFMSLY